MLGGLRDVSSIDAEPLPKGSTVAMVMDFHPSSVGGVQTHVRELTRFLEKMGYRVLVVTRRLGKGDIKDLEAEGHYLVKSLFNIEIVLVPPDPADLKRELRAINPDFIHSHHIFTLTSLLALKAAKEIGKARIATNHSIFYGYDRIGFWRIASVVLPTRYLLPYSQAVISVSSAADNMVKGIIDDLVDRYIIPNGIDSERFTTSIPEDPEPTVLFVGRLVWRKGVHVLVKAFKTVVGEIPDAKLLIAGKGEFETVLRLMVKRYDIEGRVRFLGVVPEHDKPSLYSRSWVATMPTIANESFGIVALEAMASGRPVVASRHGGLKDVVIHGETGLLVTPGSSRELAQALITLLQDPILRRRMGANARRLVLEKYDWRKIVPDIVKLYGYYYDLASKGV